MSALTRELIEKTRLQAGRPAVPGELPSWRLPVLQGRLVELTASRSGPRCGLSAVAAVIHEAQSTGEPVIWISTRGSLFFPPDFAANGIDLRALPLVRVETEREAAWAADEVLRSGGVGLVVLDLGAHTRVPAALWTRLGGLSQKHHAAVICLTERGPHALPLGSLISLRGEGCLERRAAGEFSWSLEVVKDKRKGPGWFHREVCHGPDGMC
jgi:recombination protein RecA